MARRSCGWPFPRHLVLLLQRPDPLLRLPQFGELAAGRPGLHPVLPAATDSQLVRDDSLIPKSAAICFNGTPAHGCERTTSSRNSFGNGLGTVHILQRHPTAPQI